MDYARAWAHADQDPALRGILAQAFTSQSEELLTGIRVAVPHATPRRSCSTRTNSTGP